MGSVTEFVKGVPKETKLSKSTRVKTLLKEY